MSDGNLRVLHIGGALADSETIRKALAESKGERFDVEWTQELSDGLDRLIADRPSVVLLDLRRPECPGINGLRRLFDSPATPPVVVVGSDETEETARQIIHAGASDYLLTSHLDSYWLPRAIRTALERREFEEAFAAETERVEATLNSLGDGLICTDLAGRITGITEIAEAITGWRRAEAIGQPVQDVLQVVDSLIRDPGDGSVEPSILASQSPSIVSTGTLTRRDGSESVIEHSSAAIHGRQRLMTGTAIVFRDVSAARAKSLRMFHLASHDPLTDLPNRLLLTDRLARALSLAHRHHRRLAVLFLDLDRFKHINDTLGHLLGDELLQSVAREVTMCVRSSDTVSRQGGDEFVVVLSELEHAEDAAVGAQKIQAALARPHALSGHELHITASIGIAVYPDDGEDAETLLKHADLALYHAKDEGRDCYQFFRPALNVRASQRQSIEAGLHRAIEREEFELLYQPKVNLNTGGVIGAEALLRWRRPDRGLVKAADFVEIAEACGLIRTIGRWVVHEACRQARAWQDAGLRPIPVSVNLSADEFRGKDLLRDVTASLNETRLDPCYLEIELTEGALMAHVESTMSVLRSLKALGVQLVIDNFGTGWSSLSHLRRFPFDALKIDKSFVGEISASAPAPMITAMLSMGRSLGRRVVAEGVETLDQVAFLQSEGCLEGQGYYFSKPVTARQFAWAIEGGVLHFTPKSERMLPRA